jgi:hypothetical protein
MGHLLPALGLLSLLAAPPKPARAPAEPLALEFGDILQPGPKAEPSAKVRALRGKRVRLVGFMAHMEEPPAGAFYLVSRPLHCAEDGAGTGDLPLDAVRVVVRSSAGEEIPFYPGLLSVTGVLELGHQSDAEGRASFFRLVLDRPEDLGKPAPAGS